MAQATHADQVSMEQEQRVHHFLQMLLPIVQEQASRVKLAFPSHRQLAHNVMLVTIAVLVQVIVQHVVVVPIVVLVQLSV